jgi:DMSO/TMAO reductase YedYZ molybdopterin-dependent catalytic subunit
MGTRGDRETGGPRTAPARLRSALDRLREALEPHPRVVDWSLFALLAVVLGTGVLGFLSGRPDRAWVFVTHGVAGLSLVAFLYFKLRRVRHRFARPTVARALSALMAVTTVGALATGVWWAFGGALDLGPWGLLNLHVGLGLLVVPLLGYHLTRRFRPLSTADFEGRRTALQYTAVVAAGALAWRLQGSANRLLDTAGARRRFTGSRETGSDDGNAFPVTAWVADDPDPVPVEGWSLSVRGAVDAPTDLAYGDLPSVDGTPERPTAFDDREPPGAREDRASLAASEDRALLDCTSGWYSEHDWQGIRVGDLIDAVGVREGAAWVQFRSVTGYRWSLPLEEARDATLATHVDGERLAHGHGFPLRLVAPGRRGFQWVKWVEEVRVTRRRDRSEWIAVFVSGVEE